MNKFSKKDFSTWKTYEGFAEGIGIVTRIIGPACYLLRTKIQRFLQCVLARCMIMVLPFVVILWILRSNSILEGIR